MTGEVRIPVSSCSQAGARSAEPFAATANSRVHDDQRGRHLPKRVPMEVHDDAATAKVETRVQTEPIPRRNDEVTSPPHEIEAEKIVVDVLPDDPRCKIVLDPGSESAADEMFRLEEEVFGGDTTKGIANPTRSRSGRVGTSTPILSSPRSSRPTSTQFDWYFFRTTSPEMKRREGCFVRCFELMEKM